MLEKHASLNGNYISQFIAPFCLNLSHIDINKNLLFESIIEVQVKRKYTYSNFYTYILTKPEKVK